MGVRRLFSRGGQNFPGEPKKCLKHTLFFQKVKKHTILAGQGGASAPSCPPLRTPKGQS